MLRLSNGMHIDGGLINNVEIKHIDNVILNNKALKDAQRIQKYYDDIKE